MDGSYIFILFVFGTLLLISFSIFLPIYLQAQKRKQNRFREEKEKLEQEILKTSLEVQEKAINDMSHELHDNVGSRLNAIKRFLQAMDMPEMAKETANEIRRDTVLLMDEVIKDTRDISHTLNSGFVMSNGLVESVKKELDFVRKSGKMDCAIIVNGDYHTMQEQGRELLIFRMIQEAIANVIKHANATALHITMNYTNEYFSVQIHDNGNGFVEDVSKTTGIGLSNMRNRAAMINGTLDIKSGTDSGTTLTLTIKTI
jgi:signal transduction histidine kinase